MTVGSTDHGRFHPLVAYGNILSGLKKLCAGTQLPAITAGPTRVSTPRDRRTSFVDRNIHALRRVISTTLQLRNTCESDFVCDPPFWGAQKHGHNRFDYHMTLDIEQAPENVPALVGRGVAEIVAGNLLIAEQA